MSTERSSRPGLPRIVISLFCAALLAACGGGGGGDNGTPTGNVTISGAITFDRVPFKALPAQGLNFAGTIESPARNVVVEALDASNSSILATTATDTAGLYSLQVPAGRSVIIRAKAQMFKTGAAPTWNFRVLNNTNADALYTLDSASFTAASNTTRNLRATSGWSGTTYTGTRAAAPFAILDTVSKAKDLLVSAKADVVFPALDLYWSVQNRPNSPTYCPDTGDIISTAYTGGQEDECATSTQVPRGIYIQGAFSSSSDPDEFDQHVVAHEFGHYVENQFSRSDSIGGSHSLAEKLDLRVAMGEGWGDAFSGMVLNDPVYRDSAFSGGVSYDGNQFDMEANGTVSGWYSEISVARILWDIFDSVSDGSDTLSLGFGPLFSALQGRERTTTAFTSIFSFADALRSVSAVSTASLNQLLGVNGVSASDEFGNAETNNGGDVSVIPIYGSVSLPGQVSVCSTGTPNGVNKLGNRKFLRLNLANAARVSIKLDGAVDPGTVGSVLAIDPDAIVWANGNVVTFGLADSTATHSEILPARDYASGTYIIEVYDSAFVESAPTSSSPHCMTVSLAGT